MNVIEKKRFCFLLLFSVVVCFNLACNSEIDDPFPPDNEDIGDGNDGIDNGDFACNFVSYRDPITNKINENGEIKCYEKKPEWWPTFLKEDIGKLHEVSPENASDVFYSDVVERNSLINKFKTHIHNNYPNGSGNVLISEDDLGLTDQELAFLDDYFLIITTYIIILFCLRNS